MKNSQFFSSQMLGFILAICLVVPTFADSLVPVLLWGSAGPIKFNSNPFEKTSEAQLEEIIGKTIGESQPPLMVFVINDFCAEDVTKHSKSSGLLEKYKPFQYIPAASSPLSVFRNLPHYNRSIENELGSVSEGQLVEIKVTNLDLVAMKFGAIKKSNPHLIGALTGNHCSQRLNRRKRATEVMNKNESEPFVIVTERLLFYAERTPLLRFNGSELIDLGNATAVNETNNANGKSLVIKMDFDARNETTQFKATFDLEINVETHGYYTLRRINMSRDDEFVTSLTIKPDIYWAYNFSYHCAQNTTFSNKTHNSTLYFSNLQLQLDTKKFGDTYDCVGFTSIPIWSAMFVTAIVAIITLWGILMIMDIRTMDRFDDPKGKTISISAAD